MKNAKILDCTLRDGAYLVDKTFGDTVIHGIINGLVSANIDIIEIGFLQNDGFGEGKTVFKNGKDAARFIPKDKGNTMYTVLADFSRYDVDNLDENDGNTFDAVRVCFFKSERYDAVESCRKIIQKGYKVFVQPVDILGYSDREIIELVEIMSGLNPYCFSIVDTFGSMYIDDLERVYHLINHNLNYESKIGFHSHNNMQMSSALSQAFLRMAGERQVVVDTTVSGMGRGAGNTPTELIAQYMTQKMGYFYDMDAILDLIDTYMPGIKAKCSWGYSTPYFIAGCYSAHVNNISYLSQKNGIISKDIRYILNKIGEQNRKRYNYDLLEQTYADYLSSDVDDGEQFEMLKQCIAGKNVVIIAPGKTVGDYPDLVRKSIAEKNAVTISINHVTDVCEVDYVFVSNSSRYNYWKENEEFRNLKKIFTSNLVMAKGDQDFVVSYKRLLKCGWENMDNSAILLIRLLDKLEAASIGIAGFDGYDFGNGNFSNYSQKDMERNISFEEVSKVNRELMEMLTDVVESLDGEKDIYFITPSRFESALKGRKK